MKEIKASMAGSIWQILVRVGDSIESGQEVVVLESMKMEIPISSETAGTVKEVRLAEGDFVNDGDVILVIES